MAYIKTLWENEPSESTPVNASNLNKIEQGIYNNSVNIGELENLDTSIKNNLVEAINEIVSLSSKTILWTNSNPTDSNGFASQIIDIDLSNYDMIEILYNDAFDLTKIHSTGRVPKINSNLQTHFNGALWDRNYVFSDNKIAFGNGHKYNTYNNSSTTDNNFCLIPCYIIGYKTGLF